MTDDRALAIEAAQDDEDRRVGPYGPIRVCLVNADRGWMFAGCTAARWDDEQEAWWCDNAAHHAPIQENV